MTTLSFDAFFRDRGATKGLRDLGREAEKTKTRFEKLASSDAVGAKFGERFRQGFAKNTAKLSSVVTDRIAATAAGGKIVAAGAKVGDRFSIGFLKPAQRLGEQVSQRLTAISSSRFVSAGSKLGTHFHSGFAKATAKMSESISRAASRGGGSSGGARGFVSMGARLGGNFRAGFIKPIGGLPGIIAGLVGGAVIMGAKRLANEAGSMVETVSKTRAVFGASSKAIESWAKGAAKNLGMSRQEALSGASAFGNLFDQLGFGAKQAAAMSKGFVQMASDAGSFNDANPAEVMEAFQSATRGEYDALQKYIPTVNAAAIETYALSSGIVKATGDTEKIKLAQMRAEIAQRNYNVALKEHGKGSIEAKRAQASLASAQGVVSKAMKGSVPELTAAQKAQALYELSTRDLGKAHGDFAKTGGGFAGLQRTFAANWADLRVQIGTYFMPVFAKAMKQMNDEGFPALTRIVGALGSVGQSAGRMGKAVLAVFSTTFATAVDGATTNLTEIADWMETHQETMVRFFIRLGHGAIGFGRTLTALAASGIRAFGNMAGGLADFIDGAVPGIQGVMEGIAEIVEIFDNDAAAAIRSASVKLGEGGRNAAAGLRDTKARAYEAATAVEKRMNPVFDAAESKLKAVGNAEIWKAKQRDAAAKASIAIRDIGTKADGSQIKLKTWNERTRLGSVEQARLEGRIKAARTRMLEQREAGIKAGDSQVVLTKRWNAGREALYREFKQMGLTNKEARTLAERYGKIPGKVKTKHEQPGLKKGIGDTGLLDTRINALNNKKVAINFSTNAASVANNFGVSVSTLRRLRSASGKNLSGPGHPGMDLNRVIGPPVADPEHSHAAGGPTVSRSISTPLHGRPNLPDFDTLTNRVGRALGVKVGRGIGAKLDAARTSASAPGSPGGTVATRPGVGWGAIQAAMRRHGARTFNTYPGHHPSMERARDVYPHNWAAANAARALSGVWYVIYRMKIASKNHGNIWRTYRPTNFRGDWRHERHIHVARYDKGGHLRSGGVAVNRSGAPERILSARQTGTFDRMVRVMERGGGAGGNTYIVNVTAPNYVGSQQDLVNTMVQMAGRGQMNVVLRKAGLPV